MDTLAIRIKELRLRDKMLQGELGKKLNVSKQTVCNWEHGAREPSVTILHELANIFDVSTDYLLDRKQINGGMKIELTGKVIIFDKEYEAEKWFELIEEFYKRELKGDEE